jgi:three-Cys-motif partner protein
LAVPKPAAEAASASAHVEPADLPFEAELDPFFEQPTEQSQVKAAIVAEYFETWAKIIASTTKKSGGQRVGYIDLFAGPGRYEDGTTSTPLLILERAIQSPVLRDMLVSVLNDSAQNHSASLAAAITALPGIETLRHKPEVNTSQVDNALAQALQKARLIPSFFFIDPWGYKGLTLGLLKGAIKDWGSDCVFFFNYTRINMGIRNNAVEEHMAAIFGADRLARLRDQIGDLEPRARGADLGRAGGRTPGAWGEVHSAVPFPGPACSHDALPHLCDEALQGLWAHARDDGEAHLVSSPGRRLATPGALSQGRAHALTRAGPRPTYRSSNGAPHSELLGTDPSGGRPF